jgi:iron complex outermembrane receptor protein
MFNTSEMLQSASHSAGQQIDNTFSGFVLDNGPGAATVGFRDLGAVRTLALVNGRRVAPPGVGGVITSLDLNLIPSVLIDRIKNLFDAASAVYGSDAIAGVSNIILRSNVEGFDFQATLAAPKQDNTTPPDVCDIFPLSNLMSIPYFGSLYRNEGSTNIGIPNWSDSTSGLSNAAFFPGFVTEVDTNGDGIIDNAIWVGNGDGFLDFNFQDPYNSLERSDYVNSRDWVSPLKGLSLYTNDDYLLQDDNDTRIFYGALYAQGDTDVFSLGDQLFEFVVAENPFNPRGTDIENGIDCYAGVGFPSGSQEVRLIVSIRGDRDTNVVDVS